MGGSISTMPSSDFWLWAIGLTAMSIVAFYFAFNSLRKARIIEDVPTAKVRSAPQGYVELNGTTAYLEDEPVIAALTGRECCWYRFNIERKGNKNWRTVEKGVSSELFLIRDNTGDCIVDPEGAEVTSAERNVWYGRARHPGEIPPPDTARSQSKTFFGFHVDFHMETYNDFGFGRRYRYTEERIHVDDMLYAIGRFKTMDDVDHNANRKTMLRELLQQWKKDSAMMARFDRDQNGEIDEKEWEAARRAAEYKVKRDYAKELSEMVIHTLSKTSSRRYPFLVSTLPEFDLVRRYKGIALFSIIAFFASGGGAAWMWLGRFG